MPESTLEPQLKTSLIINGQSAQTESNNGAVTKPHPTHKASYINNPSAAQSANKSSWGRCSVNSLTASNSSHKHCFKTCVLLAVGDPPERTIYRQIWDLQATDIVSRPDLSSWPPPEDAVPTTGGSPTLPGTRGVAKCLGRWIWRTGRTGSFCVSLSS